MNLSYRSQISSRLWASCLFCLALSAFLAAAVCAKPHLKGKAQPQKHESSEQTPRGVIPFKPIAHGIASGISKPHTEAIQTKADWDRIWNLHTADTRPAPKAPALDFTKKTALVVFAGDKNTGGYGVSISKVTSDKDGLTVTVISSSPKKGDITAEMITQPFDMVEIDKTSAPVRWDWR